MNLNPCISLSFYCIISSIVQIYDTETEKKSTRRNVINQRLHKNSTQSVLTSYIHLMIWNRSHFDGQQKKIATDTAATLQGTLLPLPYTYHFPWCVALNPILFQGAPSNLSSIYWQTI